MRRALSIFVLVALGFVVLRLSSGGRGGRVTPYPVPAFAGRWLNARPPGPKPGGDGAVYLVEVWNYG